MTAVRLYILLLLLGLIFDTNPNQEKLSATTIESVKPLVDELLSKQNDMENINYVEADETAAYEIYRLAKQGGYEEGMFGALRILWRSALYRAKYKAAMEYIAQIQELQVTSADPFYSSQWHQMRGMTLHKIGYTALARQDLWKAIDEEKKVTDVLGAPTCSRLSFFNHVILSMLYLDDTDNIGTLELYINKAEDCYQQYNLDGICTIYYTYLKSEWAILNNDTQSGGYYVETMLQKLNESPNFDNPQFYSTAISYYRLIGDCAKAVATMQTSINRTTRSGVRQNLPGLYKLISEIYEEEGKIDSALIYHQFYVDIEKRHTQLKLESTETMVEHIFESIDQQPGGHKYRTLFMISLFVAVLLAISLVMLIMRHRLKPRIVDVEPETTLGEINPAVNQLAQMARDGNSDFMQHFETVYHRFWHALNSRYPDLTPGEQELCALTYINFTTQEIADYAEVQLRSIQTRRSRLRKKLNIDSTIDLRDYLLDIDNSIK